MKLYLEGIQSADRFLNRAAAKSLPLLFPLSVRARVMKRLRSVDPEGYEKLRRLIVSVSQQKRQRRLRKDREFLEPMSDEKIREDLVAVEVEKDKVAGTSLIRFMRLEGLRRILAVCVAAGYSRPQVAELSGIDLENLNALVTDESVTQVVKDVPAAIVAIANKRVLEGIVDRKELTEDTIELDKLVDRRIRSAALVRRVRKEERVADAHIDEGTRERALAERFGVDRKTGRTIEQEEKS